MIIKYKTFKSSEDFEQWQRSGSFRIINIQPIFHELDMTEKGNKVTGAVEVAVFVTFAEQAEAGGEER